MTVVAHDPAQAVAEVVAAESTWVPAWQRIVATAALTALPLLVLLARLDPISVAVVAAVVALGARLAPAVALRPLHRDGGRGTVRRVRERCLTAYVVTGLLLAGTLSRGAEDPWALAVTVTAAGLSVLQHRPPSVRPTVAVAAELLDSLALLGILPLVAMATKGWWQ